MENIFKQKHTGVFVMWTLPNQTYHTNKKTPQSPKRSQLVPCGSCEKKKFLVLTDPTSGNISWGDHIPDITNIRIIPGQTFSCRNLSKAKIISSSLSFWRRLSTVYRTSWVVSKFDVVHCRPIS